MKECYLVAKDGVYELHAGVWGPFSTEEQAVQWAKRNKKTIYDGYHDVCVYRMGRESTRAHRWVQTVAKRGRDD